MVYVKDPPTTLPEAMARIKELEKKVQDLVLAMDLDTMPIWLVEDMQEILGDDCAKLGVDTQA